MTIIPLEFVALFTVLTSELVPLLDLSLVALVLTGEDVVSKLL